MTRGQSRAHNHTNTVALLVVLTHNHGIETGAGEATSGSSNEVLSILKLGLEVRLLLGSASCEGRAVVEALVNGRDRGESGGKGQKTCRCAHCDKR